MSRVTNPATPEGKAAILKRLDNGGTIECRYGQGGWVYPRLPKPAVRADVLELQGEGKARVFLGRLMTPEGIAKEQGDVPGKSAGRA